ncbi:MAG: Ni/Fe-hydrogenase cytochrome b subunit [Chloroflexi bacterium]|nr:Ni/Fe-hydrogenase cytochrome b subunit [Chloroflexota bacterium]
MSNLFSDLMNLAFLFLLRVFLPLLILTAIGYLAWRFFAPQEAIVRRMSFSRFMLRLREHPEFRVPELSAKAYFILPIIVLIWIAGAGVLIARFFWGLGAVTALNDAVPWGLWIGFDVMAGVALAAGGFSLAATVYVFRLERYRPILRPAILTALLGYTLVIIGLVIDLGRWYNIFHVLWMWNPHSVMFEVAWCVILYTTVLALEFSPAVFERFHVMWAQRLLHKIIVPLVILGCVLSTLHQSSLGSLYLIFSLKLSPVWWTPTLPVLFFVSALAVGLAMVMIEAALTAGALKRRLENDLLASLAKPVIILLAIYLAIKLGDPLLRGTFATLLTLNLATAFFWIEIVLGILIPIAIFSTKKGRENPSLRFRAALFVIIGVLLNRMDIAVFGFYDYTAALGTIYFPSLGEWVVTLAIVTAGIAVYVAAVKFLPILPDESPAKAHALVE